MQNVDCLLYLRYHTVAYSRLRLKQNIYFDLRTCARCAEIASKKIFGWLRNITNSAGIRLAAKKFGRGAAQVNKIRRGGARRRRRGQRPFRNVELF